MTRFHNLAVLAMLLLASIPGEAAHAQAKHEKITVHSVSLEGNLEGNDADRTVLVILPPSYATARARHYPVLYFLHGFGTHAEDMITKAQFDESALAAMASGVQEMIVVLPDSFSKHGGTMYANSPTVGNFEDFIAQDLIGYIDSHYRTITRRESRGLAGHSMGGQGTFRIGMKNAELFGAIYAMSPCCLIPYMVTPEAAKTPEAMDAEKAMAGPPPGRMGVAAAAAWSPAPGKPPYFLDMGSKDGVVDPLVLARWHANSALAMLPQYVRALKSFAAIGMEVGDKDFVFINDAVTMHEELDRFGIKHDWSTYDGDHTNRFRPRFENVVMPFFGKHLKGE